MSLLLAGAGCKTESRCRVEAWQGARSAIATCEQEWRSDGEPAIGAELAALYYATNQFHHAESLARSLVGTEAAADGYRILGLVAIHRGHNDEARRWIVLARALHRALHDLVGSSRDSHAFAILELVDGHHIAAFRALDDCESEAREANEPAALGSAHLLAAYMMINLGFGEAAEHELAAAAPLIKPAEGPWLHLQLGQRYGDLERWQASAAELTVALETTISPVVETSARLNLAYALAHMGQLDEAERHLTAVAPAAETQRLYSGSLVERARKQPGVAQRMLERAYASTSDDEWKALAATELARGARDAGDVDAAERWARRAIDSIERLRDIRAIEMRPWVLARRRGAYELLFSVLAARGQAREALAVWEQVQGRSLWELVIASRAATRRDELAPRAESLRAAFPSLSTAPAGVPSHAHVDAALRGRDFLVLAVAEDHVWRILSRDGEVKAARVAVLTDIEPLAAKLTADPLDAKTAEALGRLLAPADWIEPSPRSLVIVTDARLDDIPFPALMRDHRRLIDDRVLVRSTSIAAVCAGDHPRARGAIVLGDAQSNLPGARAEAIEVAAKLGATARVGADATRSSALQVVDVLHVAVHGEPGRLLLADGELGAEVIARSTNAPRLVVLSACSSASARDADKLTAIAGAFIAAGAAYVVATSRAIADTEAAAVTRRFYELGGVDDPPRALALAQREAARSATRSWANYAVYWHDAACD